MTRVVCAFTKRSRKQNTEHGGDSKQIKIWIRRGHNTKIFVYVIISGPLGCVDSVHYLILEKASVLAFKGMVEYMYIMQVLYNHKCYFILGSRPTRLHLIRTIDD